MDWRLTLGGVLTLLAAGAAIGQSSPPTSLASGGQNADPATVRSGTLHSVHWQRLPLGDAVGRLNETSKNVVFLDRRVDPAERVSLSLQNAAVDRIADALADECSLGTSRFEGLIYLGPAESGKKLATLAALRRQDVARLPSEARQSPGTRHRPTAAGAGSRRQRIAWPRLTEPRGLVIQWAKEQGWRVSRSERIPHDLWPAGQLPKLAVADQLTLLLVGFDLTFRLIPNTGTIEIVPLDEVPSLTQSFDLSSVEQSRIDQLAERFPETSLQLADGKLRAAGRWEDLEQIGLLLRGPRPPRPAELPRQPGKQVFTLRVEEQPVGAVLEALARQTSLELVVDEAAIHRAGRSLDRRVSLAVENVELDRLLDELLRPAGLAFEREGQRVQIGPR